MKTTTIIVTLFALLATACGVAPTGASESDVSSDIHVPNAETLPAQDGGNTPDPYATVYQENCDHLYTQTETTSTGTKTVTAHYAEHAFPGIAEANLVTVKVEVDNGRSLPGYRWTADVEVKPGSVAYECGVDETFYASDGTVEGLAPYAGPDVVWFVYTP
jgi:hypothetical protein